MSSVVLFWLISIIVLGSHVEVNVNKINGAFYAVAFFAVIGMDACIRACGKIIAHIRVSEERKRRLTNTTVCMFTAGLLLVYTACFADFSVYYFGGNYSKETYLLSYFHIPVTETLEFIEEDNLLHSRETQMAEPKIVYAISALTDPAELKVWEKEEGIESYKNYRFNILGEISDQNNYIVRDGFEEYCAQLRAAGFREECILCLIKNNRKKESGEGYVYRQNEDSWSVEKEIVFDKHGFFSSGNIFSAYTDCAALSDVFV